MIKRILIIFFIAISFYSCHNVDNRNYDMKIFVNENRDIIINSKFILNQSSDTIILNLTKYAMNIKLSDNSLSYQHKSDSLYVFNTNKKHIRKLEISYKMNLDSFYAGNDSYLLIRMNRWCPFVYDTLYNFKLKIEYPDKYVVYSPNEIRKKRKDKNYFTNEFQCEKSSSFFVLISSKDIYKNHYSKKIHNCDFNFNFISADTNIHKQIIDETINSYSFCQSNIGKLSSNSLLFMEIPNIQFAQANKDLTIAGTTMIDIFKTQNFKSWVSHEIIHQWIGADIHIPFKHNNRLSPFFEESYTEFLRLKYIEFKFGKDSLKNELKSMIKHYDNEIKSTEYDVSIENNNGFDEVLYYNGVLIMFYISKHVNNHDFMEITREIFKKYSGRSCCYNDFRNILLKDNKELVLKYEKWLNQKGIPDEVRNEINNSK